jgi:ribose 5-phosphate isomerase B
MRIYIATDHAGYDLKEALKSFVESLGYDVVDKGAFEYNPEDDYPDHIAKVARAVSKAPDECRGIVLGGSGQGEAMVANRFPSVRATVYNGESRGSLYNDMDEIALSREHNNANILSLGARFLTLDEAKDAVKRWLEIPFSGDKRHIRRIKKIETVSKTIPRTPSL